jgi:hypothetical protein
MKKIFIVLIVAYLLTGILIGGNEWLKEMGTFECNTVTYGGGSIFAPASPGCQRRGLQGSAIFSSITVALLWGPLFVLNAATTIDFLVDLGPQETYRNEKFGFEFQYPSGWEANDSLIPHEEEGGVNWMPAEGGEFLVYVVRARNGFDGLDVESAPALQKEFPTLDALEAGLKAKGEERVERVTVAGQEALKQMHEGEGVHDRTTYYFFHNETLFTIGYYCPNCGNPNKRLQETVLSSFKFIR